MGPLCVWWGWSGKGNSLYVLQNFPITLNRFCPRPRAFCHRSLTPLASWSTDCSHGPPVWALCSYGLCLMHRETETWQVWTQSCSPAQALWTLFPLILSSGPLYIPKHSGGWQRDLVDAGLHLLRFAVLEVQTNAWKCSEIFTFLEILKKF